MPSEKSRVDNANHIAHELKGSQTIVVFLNQSSQFPQEGYSGTSLYLLQFAKGQQSGYLYYVEEDAGQERLVDAAFLDYAADKLKLTEFESRLRKFKKIRN